MLRGTPLHEILHLPPFWLKIFQTEYEDLHVEKHVYGKHKRQYYLFAHSKEGSQPKLGTIYYYHGGGWQFGTPEFFLAKAAFFIRLGYDVVLPSYRRIPFFNNDHIWEDIKAGFIHSQSLLRNTKSNIENIFIGGMSCGGHLSALLYLKRDEISASLNEQLKGAILLSAPLNLAMMRNSFTLKSLAGKRNSDLFKRANPIEHLANEKLSPPILCVHGTADGLVSYDSTVSFVEKTQFLNSDVIQFHTLDNKTHIDCAKWTFREDEVGELIRSFLLKQNEKIEHANKMSAM